VPFKHIIKVHILISNGHHRALEEVGAKAGNDAKVLKNNCKILNVILDRGHKHDRIIRIERGPKDDSPPTEFVKEPVPSSPLQNLGKRVNGNHKEERREGISLPQTMPKNNGVPGDPIKKHTRGGGGEQSDDLISKVRREAAALKESKDVLPTNRIKSLPNVKLEE
jgi:hypothetical protein